MTAKANASVQNCMLYRASKTGKIVYASKIQNLAGLEESRHAASGGGKLAIKLFPIYILY